MPSEKYNILEFNQHMKSKEMKFIIYADLKYLITKIDWCANNPKISSTKEIGEYIPSGYSMLTIWTFDHIKNKHTLYRGKDCMKKFCESLKKHTKNIILKRKKCYR